MGYWCRRTPTSMRRAVPTVWRYFTIFDAVHAQKEGRAFESPPECRSRAAIIGSRRCTSREEAYNRRARRSWLVSFSGSRFDEGQGVRGDSRGRRRRPSQLGGGADLGVWQRPSETPSCWATHGRFLALCGFGNLGRGLDFWDRNKKKKLEVSTCLVLRQLKFESGFEVVCDGHDSTEDEC